MRFLPLFLVAFFGFFSAFEVQAQPMARPAQDPVRMEFQALCEQTRSGPNPYFGTAQIEQLQGALRSGRVPPAQILSLRRQLARELLRVGEVKQSVGLLNETLQRAAQGGGDRRLQLQLLTDLGVAFLRLGEVENCIGRHGPAMCILPIGEAGRHHNPEPSQYALRAFQGVLSGAPDQPTVQWLANIAAMTLGQWPKALPQEHRIPAQHMRSPQDIGRFPDVATKVGLGITANAGGAVVDDFDGDGFLDVITSSQDPCTSLRFFRSTGRGRFEERTVQAGLDAQLGGLNLIHADYDNDGHLDLFVLRGGWFGAGGRMRNSLLHNNGNGTWSDHTASAGLAWPAYPTQTAAWADYDLDGDLDLMIGNEAQADNLGAPSKIANIETAFPSQLFRNNGNDSKGRTSFTDVAKEAGVTNLRFAKAVSWGDYDNDGDPDLYISNFGPNRLYRNNGRDPSDRNTNGPVTFTDVAPDLKVEQPAQFSFTTWWFDMDNDGDLDLFVADYGAETSDIATWYLEGKARVGQPLLYRNDGGRFTEVGRAFGLHAPALPMGANFGDLDNDGHLDFYLGTGLPPFEALMPNLMYKNDGGQRFVDVTFSGGFGHLQKGHGVAFADFDHDGDQDVFEEMGGAVPGDTYPSVLYENPGHGNAWVTLELVGNRSNLSAIGARIELQVTSPKGSRTIHRRVSTGGSFGGSPLRQEIGLGPSGKISKLSVFWPASGTRQVFTDVPAGRFYEVREGEKKLRPLVRKTMRLGG